MAEATETQPLSKAPPRAETKARTYHHSENADVYRNNASFVFSDENTRAVLELLDPQPGDVILDVGCGTGELTRKIHAIVSRDGHRGHVVGVDVSVDMIEKVQANSSTADGLRFVVCDGHALHDWLVRERLTGAFDKVFSSAALHWMKRDPTQVARGMHAALKSSPASGTLAIEMGGHMNTIGVRSALHGALQRRGIDARTADCDPWYFPTPAAYSHILQNVGFDVDTAYLFPRPTPLPKSSGFRGWLETFAGPFLNALPNDAERDLVLDELERQLAVDMYDEEQDQWTLMYVRLRVRATKRT